MRKKIEDFADVQLLVRAFYKKVLKDELLAPYFAFVRQHNWDKHLEVMDSFWNNIIFFEGGYFGNPMEIHQKLHYFKTLEQKHFDRWLALFVDTVDELFKGDKAELAKQRAYSIAYVMRMKILPQEEE